jgi:AcrR family transcriptional regulator
MKTKNSIKNKARLLFNQLGVRNVTLREVAQQLDRSYGNITYYYSTKEKLITELYQDMHEELSHLATLYQPNSNLLQFFLILPVYNFDITFKYLFFNKDYVELKRTYPVFFEQVDLSNQARKAKWLYLLIQLQKEGYLKSSLLVLDLEYIMELSVGIRLFYFQSNEWDDFDKRIFVQKVNRLLLPYLSEQGLAVYTSFEEAS